MAQDIWINLPVKELAKSIAFYTGIGFVPNPGPGDSEQSASFTIGDKEVVLMLFVEEAFAGIARHAVVDPTKGAEVLFSLGADSREQVDDFATRAAELGGTVFAEPEEFGDFMYGCGFSDPDGHRWNVLYMDRDKMPE